MLLHVLWVIGITAEGMSGALAAGRQKMDLFGVSTIACVTAIGGERFETSSSATTPWRGLRTPNISW